MLILGDIGNSETKIFLVNSKNIIIKSVSFSSKKINNKILKLKFKYLIKDYTIIEKILFCSVVPKTFRIVKANKKQGGYTWRTVTCVKHTRKSPFDDK